MPRDGTSAYAYTARRRRGKVPIRKTTRMPTRGSLNSSLVRKLIKNEIKAEHETKYLQGSTGQFTILATPTYTNGWFLLNGVNQGSAAINRLGRDVINKHLMVAGYLQPIALTNSEVVRIMVFWDKECIGASPALTDVISGFGSSGNYPYDPVSRDNDKRFIVLHDKLYSCNNLMPAAGTSTVYPFRFDIPLKYRKTNYYNVTGTGVIANIEQGALYILFISNNSGAECVFNWELAFKDP